MTSTLTRRLAAGLLLMVLSANALACLNSLAKDEDYDHTGYGDRIHSKWDLGDEFEWKGTKSKSHAGAIAMKLPGMSPKKIEDLSQSLNLFGMLDKHEKDNRVASGTEFEKRNDAAVQMVYKGQAAEALVVFQALEKEQPGNYAVAANMGTAYELTGQDEEALHWIKEGIARNPDSHHGSEWLHVRILEAKIALKKDPDWLKNNSVSGMDFGAGLLPQEPTQLPKGNLGEELDFLQVYDGLGYQLKERLQFVKPTDPVVGDLLSHYGQSAFFMEGSKWANVVMASAETYGAKGEKFYERQEALLQFTKEHEGKRTESDWLIIIPSVLLSCFLTWRWTVLNRKLRSVWIEGRSWTSKEKMKWVVLAMAQLGLVLALAFGTLLAATSFNMWIDTWILLAGVAIGIFGHMYGLHITQRSWTIVLGVIAWPILLMFALMTGVGAIAVLSICWACTLAVRLIQANRTKAPRGLAKHIPASVFQVRSPT